MAAHRKHIFIKRPCNPLQTHIPLFESLIDADVVDKWLNLLEGYFSVQIFFDMENITFSLFKGVPHVKDWWGTYSNQRDIEEFAIFTVAPT